MERGADLHMAQLMPLPLTVSCCSKVQIGFTFLVPAYPGCPGKEAVKWLYTVSQKKQDTKLLAITSLNINRFSKFFSVADLAVNLQQIHI